MLAKETVELVPFNLKGDKSVGDIVDIGNRRDKIGKNFETGVKTADATATGGKNRSPGGNIGITGFGENFGSLAHNDFAGAVDLGGKTVGGVDKSGKVEFLGVRAKRMKGGFHLEMGTGQGIDGDFESGLQGRAIGADVKGDGIERHY